MGKGNRTTLFLLMDHLCLVTAQSDRNKMTAQNLAICFGPVLMLHSDDVSSLDFQKPIGVLKYLLQIWPMKSGTGTRHIDTEDATSAIVEALADGFATANKNKSKQNSIAPNSKKN